MKTILISSIEKLSLIFTWELPDRNSIFTGRPLGVTDSRVTEVLNVFGNLSSEISPTPSPSLHESEKSVCEIEKIQAYEVDPSLHFFSERAFARASLIVSKTSLTCELNWFSAP